MSGWPDKPGVPLNPERYGWHWLQWTPNVGAPCYWTGEKWLDEEWGTRAATCRYLGPCPTPADVAALAQERDAAVRRGMLHACDIACDVMQRAAKCAREPDLIPNIRREFLAQARGVEDAIDAIRRASEGGTHA